MQEAAGWEQTHTLEHSGFVCLQAEHATSGEVGLPSSCRPPRPSAPGYSLCPAWPLTPPPVSSCRTPAALIQQEPAGSSNSGGEAGPGSGMKMEVSPRSLQSF